MAAISFQDLPEHITEDILLQLSLEDIESVGRVSRYFYELVTTNVQLLLHQELEATGQVIPTSVRESNTAASLLSTIRERQSGFRTIAPSKTYRVNLDHNERRLYEFLEGTLVRGSGSFFSSNGLPSGASVYDFTASSEWETIDAYTPSYSLAENAAREAGEQSQDEEEDVVVIGEDSDDKEQYILRRWKAGFEMKDFTIDPGQDLFVIGEMHRTRDSGHRVTSNRLDLHLVTLSDFQPHPNACTTGGHKGFLQGVGQWETSSVSMTLQVCDDKVFVFSNNLGQHNLPEAKLSAWNWRTGQLLFEQRSSVTMDNQNVSLLTIEDFVLLSPTTYGLIQYEIERLPVQPGTAFSCVLNVFTLVENEAPKEGEEKRADGQRRALYVPKKIATFELPRWLAVVMVHVRSDPPPRQFFPKENPMKIYPNPETGVIVIQYDCDDGPLHDNEVGPVYHLFVRKETLLGLLPLKGSGLHTAKEVEDLEPKRITWPELSPYTRFVEDVDRQDWVCYVYHYRFVSPRIHVRIATGPAGFEIEIPETYIRLYNFDPVETERLLRARRRIYAEGKPNWKKWEFSDPDDAPSEPTIEGPDHVYQGRDERNVWLMTDETLVEAEGWLAEDVRTGSKMPYTYIETTNFRRCHGLMIDDSRIIAMTQKDEDEDDSRTLSYLEVLHMGP